MKRVMLRTVNRFRSHPWNLCAPPTSSSTFRPGRRLRWYVLFKISVTPRDSTCSGVRPLIAAWVATGINVGNIVTPSYVEYEKIRPLCEWLLTHEEVSYATHAPSSLNTWRLFRIAFRFSGTDEGPVCWKRAARLRKNSCETRVSLVKVAECLWISYQIVDGSR